MGKWESQSHSTQGVYAFVLSAWQPWGSITTRALASFLQTCIDFSLFQRDIVPIKGRFGAHHRFLCRYGFQCNVARTSGPSSGKAIGPFRSGRTDTINARVVRLHRCHPRELIGVFSLAPYSSARWSQNRVSRHAAAPRDDCPSPLDNHPT